MIPEISMLIRLLAAAAASALVGLEREVHEKPAGLRTNALIGVGAALFAIVSVRVAGTQFDPGRIAAQVVTGVGFLGAGVILHRRGSVKGLTTAAVIWTVASLGLAFGMGYYFLGAVATGLVLIVLLFVTSLEGLIRRRYQLIHIALVLAQAPDALTEVQGIIRQSKIPLKGTQIGKRNGAITVTFGFRGRPEGLESLLVRLTQCESVIDCKEM